MTEMLSIDPTRCRMWIGHERLEDQLSEETCRDEIVSILNHGQRLPVLGRALTQDLTHDIELIYGSRRLFVARFLQIPLLVELRDLSDREAIIALDIENRLRKDLSPYERGRSFSAWLRAGHFGSQEELATALNISASQVSRLLKLSQLPAVLVNAFPAPTEICENWGRDLMEIWDDPQRRQVVVAGARAIGKESPRPPASKVYQRLIFGLDSEGRHREALSDADHDEVVKDERGRPLFRVRVRRKDVAILLPARQMSPSALSEIKDQLSVILQRARQQLHDDKTNFSRIAAPRSLIMGKTRRTIGRSAG